MTYKGLISPTFDAKVTEFLNGGGRVTLDYSTGGRTEYRQDENTIRISHEQVSLTAATTKVSYDQAYAEILVHELGHFVNRDRDAATKTLIYSSEDAKNWLYSREAEASLFAHTITFEVRDAGGDFRIAGTSKINDLYTKVSDAIYQSITTGNNLFNAATDVLKNYYANDIGYKNYVEKNWNLVLSDANTLHQAPYIPAQLQDSYSDYSIGGCVEVHSFLPCGRVAGDIKVGDELDLSDEQNLESATGKVTYSKEKQAPGFLIRTESGIELVCSHTAPIPTQKSGIVRPEKLLNEFVAVMVEEGDVIQKFWDKVEAIVPVGDINVQHITVGDRSFWAGKFKGRYILHHNMKQTENPDPGDWWDAAPGSIDFYNASGKYDEFGRPLIGIVGGQA